MNRQEFSTGKLHATRVLNELCSLRHFEALCDGIVRLTDGSVKISKAVLASGCPYFRLVCMPLAVCWWDTLQHSDDRNRAVHQRHVYIPCHESSQFYSDFMLYTESCMSLRKGLSKGTTAQLSPRWTSPVPPLSSSWTSSTQGRLLLTMIILRKS